MIQQRRWPIDHLTPAVVLVAVLAACSDSTGPEAGSNGPAPAGPDISEPFPIDRGDDPGTPGTYKGLWLRLVDNGEPTVRAVDGVIGVVCIGMSNGNQECSDFIQRVKGVYAGETNPAIRVVNCAVGGHAIERWNDPSEDAQLWDACISQRLPQARVRPDQVRVIWHKAANQLTTSGGAPKPAYPVAGSDYDAFFANLSIFAARIHAKFSSVQAVYTSSRSYGGFAGNIGRGEPLSYEEGHALNSWLRENSEVDGVWHGWGPYLWAPDCASGGGERGRDLLRTQRLRGRWGPPGGWRAGQGERPAARSVPAARLVPELTRTAQQAESVLRVLLPRSVPVVDNALRLRRIRW